MAKILVVEDDVITADLVASWLSAERHIVDIINRGDDALARVREMEYDILLLDWDIPGISGLDFLRQFRTMGKKTPVIMLTGKSEIIDKETGLDGGADDYLTKPFSLKELAARIRARLRQSSNLTSNELSARGIVLIPEQLRVFRQGKEIELLPKDFSLLEFFMRNPDKVFTAEAIMSRVWKTDLDSTNAFRSALKRLRQCLDLDQDTLPLIETLHGAGYRFNARA